LLQKYNLIQLSQLGIERNTTTTTTTPDLTTTSPTRTSGKSLIDDHLLNLDKPLKRKPQHKISSYRKIYQDTKTLETRITMMVLLISIVFLTHQIVHGIASNLYTFLSTHTLAFKITVMCLHVVIVGLYVANILIFYKFDRAFSSRFNFCFGRRIE
jgi:hypothetical protein